VSDATGLVDRAEIDLDGPRLEGDLVGDDLLRERGLHTTPDDGRGVGEITAAMITPPAARRGSRPTGAIPCRAWLFGRLASGDGAGGQLSIGVGNRWREARARGEIWEASVDGFAPWLEPVRRAA